MEVVVTFEEVVNRVIQTSAAANPSSPIERGLWIEKGGHGICLMNDVKMDARLRGHDRAGAVGTDESSSLNRASPYRR